MIAMRKRSSLDRSSEFEREKADKEKQRPAWRMQQEKEKEKRRIAWRIQQEKDREHERLKQKKIEEYERKRAETLGLNRKRRSPCRSRSESRSRSRSEESHHRSRVKHKSSSSQVMSEKLNKSEGNKPFFNGPKEAVKIDENELRQVVVNIHRKIPAPAPETETVEIRRVIVNHEEVTLKRRDGEGAKPIFDREELKQPEVEERRTIEAVGKSLVKKSYQKRRSASVSPRRHRTPSPRVHSSSRSHTHRSRHDEFSRYQIEDRHYKDHKSNRHYSDSRDASRDDSRRRRSPRGRSHSRERDYYRDERDYRSSRSEKEYRDYRGRSSDRSYDRRDGRDRESSRERRLPPVPYVEQVPFPVYYNAGFTPRPMLVGPAIPPPLRGPPLPGRGRPLMAPIRPPFPPRFVGPQDMYRNGLPPDPRFGRMY